mgnify:CR=1 FL=1
MAENIKHPEGDSHTLPPLPLPAPCLSAMHTVPVGRAPWFSWIRVCVDGRDADVNSTLPSVLVVKVEKKRGGEKVPQQWLSDELVGLSMNRGVVYSAASVVDAFLVMRCSA